MIRLIELIVFAALAFSILPLMLGRISAWLYRRISGAP
jgi:hypothetical protein